MVDTKANQTGHYYVGDRNSYGSRHGKGFAKFPNGDVYLGGYQYNKKHGLGTYCYKNGHRYIGQYHYGDRSGHGKFMYPDGSIYEGNWSKNKKHGEGIYYYPNGDVYTGNWRYDVRYGLGTMEFRAGCQLYSVWNDFPTGQCQIKYPGYTYHGTWNHSYPIGPGMFNFHNEFLNIGFYMLDNSCNPPKHVWVSQDIVKYDGKLLPEIPVPPVLDDTDESISESPPTPSQELQVGGKYLNLESDIYTLNEEAILEGFENESSDSESTSASMEDDVF